jgi:hypothetical protein
MLVCWLFQFEGVDKRLHVNGVRAYPVRNCQLACAMLEAAAFSQIIEDMRVGGLPPRSLIMRGIEARRRCTPPRLSLPARQRKQRPKLRHC